MSKISQHQSVCSTICTSKILLQYSKHINFTLRALLVYIIIYLSIYPTRASEISDLHFLNMLSKNTIDRRSNTYNARIFGDQNSSGNFHSSIHKRSYGSVYDNTGTHLSSSSFNPVPNFLPSNNSSVLVTKHLNPTSELIDKIQQSNQVLNNTHNILYRNNNDNIEKEQRHNISGLSIMDTDAGSQGHIPGQNLPSDIKTETNRFPIYNQNVSTASSSQPLNNQNPVYIQFIPTFRQTNVASKWWKSQGQPLPQNVMRLDTLQSKNPEKTRTRTLQVNTRRSNSATDNLSLMERFMNTIDAQSRYIEHQNPQLPRRYQNPNSEIHHDSEKYPSVPVYPFPRNNFPTSYLGDQKLNHHNHNIQQRISNLFPSQNNPNFQHAGNNIQNLKNGQEIFNQWPKHEVYSGNISKHYPDHIDIKAFQSHRFPSLYRSATHRQQQHQHHRQHQVHVTQRQRIHPNHQPSRFQQSKGKQKTHPKHEPPNIQRTTYRYNTVKTLYPMTTPSKQHPVYNRFHENGGSLIFFGTTQPPSNARRVSNGERFPIPPVPQFKSDLPRPSRYPNSRSRNHYLYSKPVNIFNSYIHNSNQLPRDYTKPFPNIEVHRQNKRQRKPRDEKATVPSQRYTNLQHLDLSPHHHYRQHQQRIQQRQPHHQQQQQQQQQYYNRQRQSTPHRYYYEQNGSPGRNTQHNFPNQNTQTTENFPNQNTQTTELQRDNIPGISNQKRRQRNYQPQLPRYGTGRQNNMLNRNRDYNASPKNYPISNTRRKNRNPSRNVDLKNDRINNHHAPRRNYFEKDQREPIARSDFSTYKTLDPTRLSYPTNHRHNKEFLISNRNTYRGLSYPRYRDSTRFQPKSDSNKPKPLRDLPSSPNVIDNVKLSVLERSKLLETYRENLKQNRIVEQHQQNLRQNELNKKIRGDLQNWSRAFTPTTVGLYNILTTPRRWMTTTTATVTTPTTSPSIAATTTTAPPPTTPTISRRLHRTSSTQPPPSPPPPFLQTTAAPTTAITRGVLPTWVPTRKSFYQKTGDDQSQLSNEYQDQCGIMGRPYIIGGRRSRPGRWPWQASLQIIASLTPWHRCGGVLVHPKWILTAAHCMEGDFYGNKDNWRIVMADSDLDVISGNEIYRSIVRIVSHPDYRRASNFPNDIALLEMNRPVDLSDGTVRTACLPGKRRGKEEEEGEGEGGAQCWISGWGETRDQATENNIMNEVPVEIVPLPQCKAMWDRVDIHVLDSQVCVGYGETGACYGDSGGPLMCERGGRFYVSGVMSWLISNCSAPNYPNVFSRVTTFMDWVHEQIDDVI